MTNDSGKHSALRQTGEGSFELVTDDGLREVSEDEPSFGEEISSAASEGTSESGSPRIGMMIVAGLVALTAVAVVGWAVSGGGDGEIEEEASEESMGFKPYAGDDESAKPSPSPPETEEEEEELAEAEEADEAEALDEDDPGWELSEDGIVVEDEGISEDEEEVDEITEDEEIPPEVLAEAEEEAEPDVRSGRRLDALRDLQGPQGSVPSPNAPSLGKTPNIFGDIGKKPELRVIDPKTGTLQRREGGTQGAEEPREPRGGEPENPIEEEY